MNKHLGRLLAAFMLIRDHERDVILHKKTGIKVFIFRLASENYTPLKGQLYIYGDNYGDPLAFATDDRTIETFSIFAEAVVWYTCYLNHPQMKILTEEPGRRSD